MITRIDPQSELNAGQTVTLAVDMNKAHLFDPKTENHIHFDEEQIHSFSPRFMMCEKCH